MNFPSFREEIHNVLLNEALREQIRVFKRDEELLTSSFNRSTFYDFDDFMTNCRSFDERWGMDVYIAEELRGKMVALLKLEQSQQTVDELKVNFIRIKSWILAFFIFFGLLQIIATFELSREIRVEIHPLVLTAFLILFLAIALAWAPIEQKYGFKFVRALKNLLKKVTENLQRDGNASQNRASSTGLKKMRAWLRKARYGHFRSRAIFLLFVFLLELVIVLLFHDSLLDKWIFLSMFIMALYIALIMHELTRLMQKEKRLRQLTEEVEKKKSALFKTSRNE
ncbi:hypothetical protein JXA02_10330 [candidate division KSB1 bacterium]|nr:hypothetical protein [candidate division KSB1 bacterium]